MPGGNLTAVVQGCIEAVIRADNPMELETSVV